MLLVSWPRQAILALLYCILKTSGLFWNKKKQFCKIQWKLSEADLGLLDHQFHFGESTIIYLILQKDPQKVVHKLFTHGVGRTLLKMEVLTWDGLVRKCKGRNLQWTHGLWALNLFLTGSCGVKPQNCQRKQQLSTVLIIFHQVAASSQCLWCWGILHQKYFLKITKSPWRILDFSSVVLTQFMSVEWYVCMCVCVCYTSESFYQHIFPWCKYYPDLVL